MSNLTEVSDMYTRLWFVYYRGNSFACQIWPSFSACTPLSVVSKWSPCLVPRAVLEFVIAGVFGVHMRSREDSTVTGYCLLIDARPARVFAPLSL